ncbi:hypothetical protein [Hyphomicrobium sp.]|uniref:hypothetical protein n=1 Tax=Hyphomicrobium sp. TaxID=82 RepID=UPI0025C09971|nr:hypothetical protein [Hyphomicrobium sp.]MCC7254258.1 hypothetical protein [Hyphomicrobium sp.]
MRYITYGKGGYKGPQNPNIIEDKTDAQEPERDRIADLEARLDALERGRGKP